MFNENEIDVGLIVKLNDGNRQWRIIGKNKNNSSEKFTITLEEYTIEDSNRDNIDDYIKNLITSRKYEDCAKYLIDNENVIDNEKFKKFKQKIKDKTHKDNYFVDIYLNKAKNEKNKEKAVVYYEKYLAENGKEKNIPFNIIDNLINIYFDLKKFDKAIDLFDKIRNINFKEIKNPAKINDNLYSKILDKINNEKYNIDENSLKILEKYHKSLINRISYKHDNERFNRSISCNIEIANIISNKKNFDKAFGYLDKICTLVDQTESSKYNLNDEIKEELIKILCKSMINYSNIDHDKSKRIADTLLKIDKNNSQAHLVKDGKFLNIKKTFDQNIDKFIFIGKQIKSQKQENYYRIFRNYNKSLLDKEDNLKEFIKENIFTSNSDKKYKFNNVSYKELAERNFAIAQIIIDNENNFTEETISFLKENYYLSIAEGCCLYANSRLQEVNEQENVKEKNIDQARYGYLQNIIWYKFNENNIKDKTSWRISVERYIKSFFVNSKENLEQDKYVYFENEDVVENTLKEFISKENDKIFDLDRVLLKFTIGMIELLYNSNAIEDIVLTVVLNSPYKNKIVGYLSEILDKENNNIESLKDLKNIWKEATDKYNGFAFEEGELCDLIKKCLENLFQRGQFKYSFENLKDYIENADSKYYKKILAKIKDSNFEYINRIYKILESVYLYNKQGIDYKINKFIDYINKPLNEIFTSLEKYPTFFYYETNWGMKDKNTDKNLKNIFEENIEKEKKELLKYNSAKLDILAEYHSWIKNIIEINIILKNDSKPFLDEISIEKIELESEYKKLLKLSKIPESKYYLGSSKVYPVRLQFEIIDDKIWDDCKFSFDIKINYTYKNIVDSKTINSNTDNYSLTVDLTEAKNFKKINNSFKHFGKLVVNDPNNFYGRDNEIKEIIKQYIIDDDGNIFTGRALALYGQQRAGKSSLLHFLKLELNKYKNNIIVDIGDIVGENKVSDLNSFLKLILNNILNIKAHEELLPCNIQVNKEINNTEDFNNQFKSICNLVHKQNRQIILMIDEFTHIYDLIKENKMTYEFLRFWKNFINNNEIFAIVIGQDHMMSIVNDQRFTNSLVTTTDFRKVTYLEKEYAKELMYNPIILDSRNSEIKSKFRYTDKALDYLYELTSGNAYLITQLCRRLIDYLNKIKNFKVTKSIIRDFLEKILFDPNSNDSFNNESEYYPLYEDKEPDSLEEQNKLKDKNKKIIRKIAVASDADEEGWVKIEDILSPDKEIAKKENELIERLESRDVLTKKNGKYKIKVGLYREWILNRDKEEN